MTNKFGICEWSLPERGVEAIHHAARIGFEGIQLTELGGWETGFPLLKPELQDAYRQAREETGIVFQALHLWSLCRLASMVHPVDSVAGQIAVQSIKAAVQACCDLNIPAIMVTSGFLCSIKNRLDFETFASHLKIACEIAGEKEVKIVFESALSASELLEMRSIVGNALHICYDTFNPVRFHMEGKPEDDIIKLGKDFIDHFHLKDGPEHMVGCSLLGQGAGNFQSVVEAVHSVGYQNGWFITENYYDMFPLNQQGSFDELAAKDLATMRASFAKTGRMERL